MKNVVIGFLGTQLDLGRGADRFAKWRPTVSLVQHASFPVARLHLLHSSDYARLAETVTRDIATLSPETLVVPHLLELRDPWDFEEVYSALHDFARKMTQDNAQNTLGLNEEPEQLHLHITTGTHVAQICWFLLAEARYFEARLLQTSPQGTVREKTNERGTLHPGRLSFIDLDLSRYSQIAQRFAAEQQQSVAQLKSGIATRNAAFNRTIDEIERVAIRSREPVLLEGPTGAGKSMLARRMYELKRSNGQITGEFVEVNCATLRGDGAMSALFGHKKGAYTGAVADRPGLLLAANGGQLFLDEIGELGADEQAMLLKALEDKRFLPVGSDRAVASDFQLIAGTNRALRDEVRAGRFRDDLYARLNTWTFTLPSLAERREDIDPNIDFELARYGAAHQQRLSFVPKARAQYLAFATSLDAAWEGNFRDLHASLKRMATLAERGRIDEAGVAHEIARLRARWSHLVVPTATATLIAQLADPALTSLDLFDAIQLEQVLAICQQSATPSDAGRSLFAHSRLNRKTPNDGDRLAKYLSSFGLDWAGVKARLG